jgi:hypothetical protein
MSEWQMRIPVGIRFIGIINDQYVIEGDGSAPVATSINAPGRFVWPADFMGPHDETDRTSHTWRVPGTAADSPQGSIYSMQNPDRGAPSGGLSNAGIIKKGRYVGHRLWAPGSAPDAMLTKIIEEGDWP